MTTFLAFTTGLLLGLLVICAFALVCVAAYAFKREETIAEEAEESEED